jgi:hypothetical protein
MVFAKRVVFNAALICVLLNWSINSAYAQTSDINIPRHLDFGECGVTPENTYKVCRDMEGKYRTWPISGKEGKKVATKKEQLRGNYLRCLYRSLGRGEVWTAAFHNCLDKGIELCNGEGVPTSKNYDISAITGRVRFSNDQCGIMLNSLYAKAEHSFINEYENYARAEAVGGVYTPITLDLRKYVGQHAQTNDESIPQVSCNDIGENGSPNYWQMMTKLASIAEIDGGEFNRENEEAVGAFCKNNPEGIKLVDSMVDNGSISAREAEAVAYALGKQYKAPQRTASGKNYERVKTALSNLGFCMACADTIALEYANNPNDVKSKLVDAALTGDTKAIKRLQDNMPPDDTDATHENSKESGLSGIMIPLVFAGGIIGGILFLITRTRRRKK